MEPIKQTELFGALTGATGDGRGNAFRETRSDEAIKALVDAVHKNLKGLQKKYGIVSQEKATKVRDASAVKATFVPGSLPSLGKKR